MFSLCLSVCFSVNMVESDTGWWNQGHFLQCEKHQFPFFHWGRERELGEGASPHICTLCHTGKCCNCLCPSDCLQTCRCISWISLKIFFSFHWCAIMCYEGFFFFFFFKSSRIPTNIHEDIVSASLQTPITVPAAAPGPLLAQTCIPLAVLCWFAVILFFYFLTNLCDTGRTRKPTMKWAHPQLR